MKHRIYINFPIFKTYVATHVVYKPNISLERKSIRRSTAAKSAATLQRLKERTEEGRRRKGRRARARDEWQPTQEELLEEAKITEQENLKSLGKYTKYVCTILWICYFYPFILGSY